MATRQRGVTHGREVDKWGDVYVYRSRGKEQ